MFDENCFFSRLASACIPNPQWAGGLQPRARAACVTPAPGGRGTPAARQSGAHAPGTRLAVGASAARRSRIPFFESTYNEMQRKHIPRVNEYQ